MSDPAIAMGPNLDAAAAELFADLEAVVRGLLHVALQALAKVLEHGRPAREHNVLVQPAARVNGALLHDRVDEVRDRRRKVGVDKLHGATTDPTARGQRRAGEPTQTTKENRERTKHLGVEEDFGAEEALVADVDGKVLLRDAVRARVLLDPLLGLLVVPAGRGRRKAGCWPPNQERARIHPI